MKKSKLLLIITLTAICMLGVVMAVYASSANQDCLYAEIITDKENYAINEDIKITVKLENRNDFPVENISIEGLIPDGLTLKNGQVDKNVTRLKANEKVELSFTAIKKANTTTVKRKVKVKSIKLNKKKVTLRRKQSIKLKVKIKPSNASNKKIKWYSSNKKVAKVNSKGKVTALKKGKAKIYAKAKDGTKKKAVCKVTVKKSKKKNKRK